MLRGLGAAVLLLLLVGVTAGQQSAQPTFAVASVKPSSMTVGKDHGVQTISYGPDSVRGHNVTLKHLIREAYGLRAYAFAKEPDWLDRNEYELDARSDGRVSPQELRTMLQTLIKERFHLVFHWDSKSMNVYSLVQDKAGSKIRPLKDVTGKSPAAFPMFRGSPDELADLIGVQLSIPTPAGTPDPSRPIMAAGSPMPVVNATGLAGVYEINVDVKPSLAMDMFTSWQRFLQEQCGLKLESRKSTVQVLVIDKVDAVPVSN